MVAIFLAPVYILVNVYVLLKAFKWLKACHGFFHNKIFKIVFGIVYVFLASSLLIAFFLPTGHLQRVMKQISNYWLGTFMYILLFCLIADLILLILYKTKRVTRKAMNSRLVLSVIGAIVFCIVIIMSIYGILNAHNIKVKNYQVSVEKECKGIDNLKVVLVADTHLGYSIGCDMMEQMVQKINQQEPDLVCFAGDFFDNEYEALDDPERLCEILRGIQSTYGVYACYGNHDIQEPILAGFTFGSEKAKLNDERMTKFVEDAGMVLLRDESVCIEDAFTIVGRRDAEKPGNEEESRMSPEELLSEVDLSKPVIVIDHEPRQLEELAESGADLDLCGHTHAGQMFPGNLTIHLFWENAWGYLKVGDMHNFVTSGIGVFGPYMRTFTDSEIMSIEVSFTGNK